MSSRASEYWVNLRPKASCSLHLQISNVGATKKNGGAIQKNGAATAATAGAASYYSGAII